MLLRRIGNLIMMLIFITLMSSTPGCQKQPEDLISIEIDSIKKVWVPDTREGIFEVNLRSSGPDLILKGETNIPAAKEAVISLLRKRGVEFLDSLIALPDTAVIREPWGLVNVSVSNLRSAPAFNSEMVSQALMGTPVRILKKDGGWFLIQTPDMYLGWVDSDAIESGTDSDHNTWKSSRRVFYTKKTGDILEDQNSGKAISDIVAGCIVEVSGDRKGFYEVRLPDGRKGFVSKEECILLDDLTTDKYLKPENLLSAAVSFTGIPYLWGGTSVKGFDCSGFVKTVYFLNGLILARDASLQFRNGIEIGKESYPDSLKKGDLLFFGSYRDGIPRATHVGIYIGDSEFIHASGMVKINSLDSTRSNFSRYRKNSFLGTRRIIGAKTGNGIRKVLEHNWYK